MAKRKAKLVARGQPVQQGSEYTWDQVTVGHKCANYTKTLECSETVFVEGVGVTYQSALIKEHPAPTGLCDEEHQPSIVVCDDDDDDCLRLRTVWVEGKPDAEGDTKLHLLARADDVCTEPRDTLGPIEQKSVYVG